MGAPKPDLLDGLSPQLRADIESRCAKRRFARRQALFHLGDPGDGLYLIRSGRVVIRISTPTGEEASLTVVGPGQALGEQSLLFGGGQRSASAIALESVETLFLSRAAFSELRAANPQFSDLLVEVLTARVLRLTNQLVEALFVPASVRVLRRVAETASLYDTRVIPLTQEEVASMAGTTRPTVNRVLRAAEAEGVLDLARGRIRVVDLNRLRGLAAD